jgi:hypothetical protein
MTLRCTHCDAGIEDAVVDRARQIATCGACRRLVDLQPQMTAPATSRPPMREPVSLPAGMTITDDGAALTIRRRWLRRKHLGFLVVLVALAGLVAYRWLSAGFSAPLVVGTIFLTTWHVRLLSMFVNATTVRVTADRIDVRHGPLPSLLFRNRSLAASEIRQLFAAKWGAVYEVGAELKDGSRVSLVRPLVSDEQALFVEQQLEHRLGIVDFEVAGELASGRRLPAEVPAAVSRGSAGALAALPFVIIGTTLVAFFVMTSSDVDGTFEASGPRLGSFTFAPDHCTSGQTRGFFGVELTSRESENTVVRAVRDPVRGALIAIERPDAKPIVLSPEECRSLEVRIDKTSTSINDVWAVEGRAAVDCAELRGEVTFEGCH